VVAILAVLAALSAAAPLPLGPAGLHEHRATHRVAGGVTWTHIVRRGRGGPFRVDVLEVDSALRLGILTAHDRVPGLEQPSAMARRHDAVAGVNGGYFAGGAPDTGDPTGVVAAGGRLLSEPVGARTALVIGRDGTARVTALRFHGRLAAGGARRLVDGVNRNRGRIPACGGRGGDAPTQAVDPSTTCTDASELVVLTPQFGPSTRTAAGGVEAVVRDGAVTSVRRAADTPIPDDGYVLTGSGDAARFLRRHLAPGDRPQLKLGLGAGEIVGGAPRLLRDGNVRITAAPEGRGADTAREPRTIAGVTGDGRVLLITVDGRQPGWSLGATLREAARVARALGAEDALSFDSGGSTAMIVGRRVVNRPSEGERAVADGLFVLSS
jgi:exopolysaccharide biosynthesis protein